MNSPALLSADVENFNSANLNSEKTLKVFMNSEFGEVRTLLLNGEPYFVGKDVALILGYSNPQKAIRDHVDDEDKTVNESFTVNGTMIVLINESGLYSLILSSKLPGAKKFKHWVTSEVLPSIRKSGGYSIPKTFAEALLLAGEQQKKIEAMQPKVEVYETIANADGLKAVEEVAKNLGYGKNNFFELMRNNKIFYYANSNGSKINLPKQTYLDCGYFKTKEQPFMKGTENQLYTKIYVTGKGEIFLTKFVQKLNNSEPKVRG